VRNRERGTPLGKVVLTALIADGLDQLWNFFDPDAGNVNLGFGRNDGPDGTGQPTP
jgi:hypothetical protein